ncbi:ABC transporter substrate binding protein [Clostridium sp. DL1XJH146]
MKRKVKIAVLAFVVFIIMNINCQFVLGYNNYVKSNKNVLILSSYHEGYKWSDDIVQGIKAYFGSEITDLDVSIEYMDTQKNSSKEYLGLLSDLYMEKYKNANIDVIISCDDVAYNFMRERGERIFGDTPFVFCGVNYFQDYTEDTKRNFTGIKEEFDIKGTIDLALKINKEVKNVYVINDTTVTGKAIEKEFDDIKSLYEDDINFISIGNMNIEEISHIVSKLDNDSIVLFMIYFEDGDGEKFNYDESVKIISEASSVPIYGLWEFLLGNGIVGGNLTSGFYQGSKAAVYADRILKGENPCNIPISSGERSNYKFDYEQLDRFSIEKDILPYSSIIINEEFDEKKNILVLNSYHSDMTWVEGIKEGIEKIFDNEDLYELTYDYMDTKRFSDPIYIEKISELLEYKYNNKKYDIVIVSDDDAFEFISKYGERIFGSTPIVFCGINYLNESKIDELDNITGVVESIDIESTIDIALEQNKNISKIVVINDTSATGEANREKLEEVIPKYSDRVEFFCYSDINMNMNNLLDNVSKLDENSVILLLSFNRDKSNNIFDYYKSGELISRSANVPVYVVWDFYLGSGVLGGKTTNGNTQGEKAAHLALKILEGASVDGIDVIYESPNEYMFDYSVMNRFGIEDNTIPDGSVLINKEKNFYEKNKVSIIIFIILFIILIAFIIEGRIKLKLSKIRELKMEQHSSIDILTGAYSRRKGFELLEREINEFREEDRLTICFIDVDNLKEVNDKFGHEAGDILLSKTVEILKEVIRENDVLIRLGGDEFLIIFPNSSLELCTALIASTSESLDRNNSSSEIKISFSTGFARYTKGLSVEDFVSIADNEMYREKQRKKSQKYL